MLCYSLLNKQHHPWQLATVCTNIVPWPWNWISFPPVINLWQCLIGSVKKLLRFEFHIQSAEDSHEFKYTLHSWHFFVVVVVAVAFFFSDSSRHRKQRVFSLWKSSSLNVRGKLIKAVQSVCLFSLFYMSRYTLTFHCIMLSGSI